ncbi:ABC transporter substrate-binding protein [Paenarthrobacter sp. NPDC058040]|uniref:ABC transporter substrate-binding protein n=1 Tax=unclassified Paenarthrobacter TaxID=2634190 RepID=UPI0036D820BC
MTTHWTVALRDYEHTMPLKNGTVVAEGVDLEFVDVEPIHRAFAPMVRESRYDFSELAIATLFQALEAERPVIALPVVLHGNFHHRSISIWNGEGRVRPEDLAGKKVGVRAHSQTTGLWVRGMLADTYGLRSQDVTWVTTEGPHVATASEPANVVRTDRKLVELLTEGEVSAVVMGARSADHVPGLEPLLPDWKDRQDQYHQEHGWVPINHLLVVRRELAEANPDGVRAVYRAFQQSIDAARPAVPTGTTREKVIQYGVTDSLLATLDTALRYAREQEIIHTDLSADRIFADFEKYVGEP